MSTREIEARAISRRAEAVLAALRAHEPELRACGIEGLSLFGSLARGDDDSHSDVDIAVRVGTVTGSGFAYFARLQDLQERLGRILDSSVDMVTEPVRNPKLQRALEAERIVAF